MVSNLSSCKISQSKIQNLKTSTTYLTSIPTRQPTPVSLPGESHGQRSLAGYSPWAHRESTTERLSLTQSTRPFSCAWSFHLAFLMHLGSQVGWRVTECWLVPHIFPDTCGVDLPCHMSQVSYHLASLPMLVYMMTRGFKSSKRRQT